MIDWTEEKHKAAREEAEGFIGHGGHRIRNITLSDALDELERMRAVLYEVERMRDALGAALNPRGAPMRDPKNHAKVLACRKDALWRARTRTLNTGDVHRRGRLDTLLWVVNEASSEHADRTGWSYWPGPSAQWRHTTVIPDSE